MEISSLASAAYAVGILVLTLMLAAALGRKILLRLLPTPLTEAESLLLGTSLGLGCISYAILGLGLIKVLNTVTIGLTLALIAFATRKQILHIAGQALSALRHVPEKWKSLSARDKLVAGLVTAILLTAFFRALAPVTGYDALMYHLEGPRHYLEQGRIFPSTSRWYINLPFAPELLFALGLALGSEVFSQLLEFSWLLILIGMILSFARRFLPARSGLISVGTLFTMPVIPIWAGIANVDIAVAALEFAAIYSAILWMTDRRVQWIILSGLFSGVSLGSKYSAFATVLVVSIFIIYSLVRSRKREGAIHLFAFILVSALVALPWYLKNYLWLGDPLFPFLGGGAEVDALRMSAFLTYVNSFRPAQDLISWLKLPFLLYFQPELFAETAPGTSWPSPVFLAAAFAPAVAKRGFGTKLLAIAGLRYTILSMATLQMRFLLPVFVLLSLSASHSISATAREEGARSILNRFFLIMITGLLVFSLLLQVGLLLRLNPFAPILGLETKDAYLSRLIPTYTAMSYARENLPERSKLLTTGDGRTYYCQNRCIDTDDQFLWSTLLASSETVKDFVRLSQSLGATHLLYSQQDVDFFESRLGKSDPQILTAVRMLKEAVMPACGRPIYEDSFAAIFSLDSCGN